MGQTLPDSDIRIKMFLEFFPFDTDFFNIIKETKKVLGAVAKGL